MLDIIHVHFFVNLITFQTFLHGQTINVPSFSHRIVTNDGLFSFDFLAYNVATVDATVDAACVQYGTQCGAQLYLPYGELFCGNHER